MLSLVPLSWWNPNHEPSPPGVTYSITMDDLLSYKQFASMIDVHFILDTDFRWAGSETNYTTPHVAAIAQTLGWDLVSAVEIGNEPGRPIR